MKKKLLSIVTTICLGILLVACGGQSGDTDKVIKLGINGEVNQIWKSVQSRLADEGIDLQFVTFSDYNLPNQALADGEIDANSFQTIAFFEQFINDHNLDLTSIIVQVSIEDDTILAYYDSFLSAAKALGKKTGSAISESCRNIGYHKTAYGYKWRYLKDVL